MLYNVNKKDYDFTEYLLKKHDWYYRFSDDFKVYNKGNKEEKQLLESSYLIPYRLLNIDRN